MHEWYRMKKCIIFLVLCVYSLVICSVVYYAVWHNPVKDYDSIPLKEWVKYRAENNTTNYDIFFAEGRKFFNELDMSLDETDNIVLQEMSKIVVPLSKQYYHGKIIVYDALYFRMLLCEEYERYTSAIKRK